MSFFFVSFKIFKKKKKKNQPETDCRVLARASLPQRFHSSRYRKLRSHFRRPWSASRFSRPFSRSVGQVSGKNGNFKKKMLFIEKWEIKNLFLDLAFEGVLSKLETFSLEYSRWFVRKSSDPTWKYKLKFLKKSKFKNLLCFRMSKI